jgi:glycosyltransferase involved in cell wall biosynthesis
MDVLFAAERTRPRPGGAERYARELLAHLSRRHRVRVVWLEPERASPDRYWQAKTRCRERARIEVTQALGERGADLVLTQLHAAPGATAAAREAGVAVVQLLPSYEALCRYAFLDGSECLPLGRCRSCPAALRLSRAEQRELARSRDSHELALAEAGRLIAPSAFVAEAYRRWCGHEPVVAYPVTAAPEGVSARPDGPAVLVAAGWKAHKGLELLAPIAEAAGRDVVVAGPGLPRMQAGRLRSLAHVTVSPYRPISRLLDGAGALLVPSQWPEPFGRIAFEGLAAGVPTLASATGGLPELVPPGQLVHDYREPGAWVRALRGLDGRWDEARRDGLASAERILATHPLERVEDLLTRPRSP